MRWLVLLAAVVAALFALWILLRERREGQRRSTFRQLAIAVLWLAILGAAAFAARWIGLLAIPVIVVGFLPFGLVARWSILATRESRIRAQNAAPRPPRSTADRLLAALAWPVFLTLVAVVVAAGIVVAMLVGPH
jgi:hypothetical protein